MGLTLSGIYRMMYKDLRNKGYSHDRAMDEFPQKDRERIEEYIKMSFIESHFGMKPLWFFITLGAVVISLIIIASKI